MQDKAGGDITAFKKEADKFVEALSQRPEIGEVYSSFATDYPQYWVEDSSSNPYEGYYRKL